MSAANQPDLMTVAEYLDWVTPDGSERWELVEGRPWAMAPSSPLHGMVAAQVAYLFGSHLQDHPRCRGVVEPGVQPRVRGRLNVRIPDYGVTCTPIEPDARLLHEPVVLVEILSPSNTKDALGERVELRQHPSGAGDPRAAYGAGARGLAGAIV
jgi:Uma2 family endonuclease